MGGPELRGCGIAHQGHGARKWTAGSPSPTPGPVAGKWRFHEDRSLPSEVAKQSLLFARLQNEIKLGDASFSILNFSPVTFFFILVLLLTFVISGSHER